MLKPICSQTLRGYPAALQNRYPDPLSLAEALSTPRMMEIREQKGITKLSDCIRMPFPSLKDVEVSHGSVAAIGLIRMYLISLNDSMNQNRMTTEQIFETSQLIYEEGYFLKVTELHEFFLLVKKGAYGEYYGSIDCLKLMSDFGQFLANRNNAIRRMEAQHRTKVRNEQWQQRQQWWNDQHPQNQKPDTKITDNDRPIRSDKTYHQPEDTKENPPYTRPRDGC